jgi:SAM-dependent methyltransferase
MIRIRFDGCDLSRPRGTPVNRVYPYDRGVARYDGIADWYDTDFLGDVHDPGREAAIRLLGEGRGRLLDIGCGTGAQTVAFRDAGWEVTGVDASEDMLRRAQARGLEATCADATELPFADASFDAVVSLWTHTDIDGFDDVLAEAARVLRPGGPLVYAGGHPCFVGPHSRFLGAEGVPELHSGYLGEGRYGLEAPGVGTEGLRAKVGAVHLTLGCFLQMFLDAGLRLEHFEELENRPYPFAIALRWRR